MSVTFNGGSFERYLPIGQDCVADFVVADPSPAQLGCLAFSLPATVTVPSDDYNKNNTLVDKMAFFDTSPACGSSDLVSRLSTAYGYNVTGLKMDGYFNNQIEPYDVTFLRAGFDMSTSSVGKRRDLVANCDIQWVPSNKLVSFEYVLEYKNPICGLSAPKLVDASQENRVKLTGALVDDNQMITISEVDYQSVLSEAYGESARNIQSHRISATKFNITVSSSLDYPTSENSCVYNFVVVDRRFSNRVYSLLDYDFASQPLLPDANIKDGCIDEMFFGMGPTFKNSSDECGFPDAGSRFQRYFGGTIKVKVHVLDEANTYLNFTVVNGGRRDAGDITFHYFDKSFISTTAIASTVVSTALSTSTLSVASTTSVVTATTVIDTLSTSTINDSASISTVVASVSTSTLISSVGIPTAIASVKGSAVTTVAASIASNAVSTTVAIPTVVPTGNVAPTGNSGPTAYGVPVAANNIYKSDSAGVVGLVSAFIISLLFAF